MHIIGESYISFKYLQLKVVINTKEVSNQQQMLSISESKN